MEVRRGENKPDDTTKQQVRQPTRNDRAQYTEGLGAPVSWRSGLLPACCGRKAMKG